MIYRNRINKILSTLDAVIDVIPPDVRKPLLDAAKQYDVKAMPKLARWAEQQTDTPLTPPPGSQNVDPVRGGGSARSKAIR